MRSCLTVFLGIVIIGAILLIYFFWEAIIALLLALLQIVLTFIAIVVGIVVMIAVVSYFRKRKIKELARLERERNATLENRIREEVYIPVPEYAVTSNNYYECLHILEEAADYKRRIENASSKLEKSQLKNELSNFRLKSFYVVSLRHEVDEEKWASYETKINNILSKNGDWNLLRIEDNEKSLVTGKYEAKVKNNLGNITLKLEDNNIDDIIKRVDLIKDFDTSGIFTTHSLTKLNNKTEQMTNCFDSIEKRYKELSDVGEITNKILVEARGAAYRNIFLGVELLNYIRDNSGGTGLKVQHDSVDMQEINLSTDIPLSSLNIDFGEVLTVGLFNKEGSKAISRILKNPKSIGYNSALIGISVAKELLKARNKAIKANIKQQKELIKCIDDACKNYTNTRAQMFRAIEIVKAIVHSNAGFMAIYAPLRDKVFIEGKVAEITRKDVFQLRNALDEYKKISDSKM